MARQNIFTGTTANDGTGDTLRVAADKINQNFVDLYQYLNGDSDQLASPFETVTASGAVSLTAQLTIFNSASTISATLADGSRTGQSKRFINDNTGAATVTPSNFAQGTSFTLAQNGACEVIWSGSNWHIFGEADSGTALTITS